MSKQRKKTGRRLWQCQVCGYIYEGPEPPVHCPICCANRASFQPFRK